MKNVRVKVGENCGGGYWWYGIYEGRNKLMDNCTRSTEYGCSREWERKFYAIKAAKAMAKRIGIPCDPEIIKQHGC